jgi:hypothetical protein
MTRSLFALTLVALLLACTPKKPLTFVNVQVDAANYHVDGAQVDTTAALIAALHAVPKLDSIYLHTSPGVASERYAATLKEIRAAGIEAPVATVENQVFNK